jgi:hypothetical protein
LRWLNERSAVIAAAIDGYAQALIEIACEADVPVVLVDPLQRGAGREAQVARAEIRLIAVIVDLVDRRHAALFAAGLDVGLHAHLWLGLSRGLLRLVLGWGCGVAARTRALGKNGVHGWQTQNQQKGKTAKRIHRFRVTSTGVRKHTTALGQRSPH